VRDLGVPEHFVGIHVCRRITTARVYTNIGRETQSKVGIDIEVCSVIKVPRFEICTVLNVRLRLLIVDISEDTEIPVSRTITEAEAFAKVERVSGGLHAFNIVEHLVIELQRIGTTGRRFTNTRCAVTDVTHGCIVTYIGVGRDVPQLFFTQSGVETEIKWVNDIYLDNKKIAGILAESFFVCEKFFTVIGIGVNMYTADFPDELCDRAGSIMAEKGSRWELAVAITEELVSLIRALPNKDFMQEYRESSIVLGKEVTFVENGQELGGFAESISDDGALTVILESGDAHVLKSGEISLRVKQ
jgi:biotin-(acetyl-CoA carboxylase) ligase